MSGPKTASGPAAWGALLLVRLLAGMALVLLLAPVSIDDAFRTFYACWWWQHPSFYPLPHWPPGYFWIYGAVCGLTGDGIVAPRLLTLALHVATGCTFILDRSSTPTVRWFAACWFFLSPLSLVLGTVPLSETLFMGCLIGGLVTLVRFLSTGSILALVTSSILYLLCTTVRYEGWAFVPVFTFLASLRTPPAISRWLMWALRLLPWLFPGVWVLLLAGVEGEPLLFLSNVVTDSFGRGSVADSFRSPLTWIVGVQVLAAAATLIAGGRDAIRRSRHPHELVWEMHVAFSLLIVVWVVASGDVPSQYTLRMFFPAIALASVPVARMWLGGLGERAARGRAVALAVVLAVTGASYVFKLAPGYDVSSHRAAVMVRAVSDSGRLHEGDLILVGMKPPATMALVVELNMWDSVQVDSTHHESWFSCDHHDVPAWMENVRVAVVSREDHARSLARQGWVVEGRSAPWTVLVRAGGAPAPGVCP